ncbi:hypothetical protein ABIA32_001214 [Streptacidiphilus sp. MAP12-20]|uniref:penicillin-binding transpeptidase domain-containing protein n=1 Tax=Streptacidiphilus sp. MAP12-20 TaxID=3156299 RepID=UPI003513062F
MNRGAKIGVGVAAAALLTVGSVGAYNLVHGVVGGPTAAPTFDPTALATTPPSGDAAQKLATAFLQSWQSGPAHYAGAASDTDSPSTAETALQGYHDRLGLTGVTFTNVKAAGTSTQNTDATLVNYDVSAQVKGGTWTYQGTLSVVQSTNGQTAVHWASSVLFPKLKDGQSVQAGAVTADASSVKVTDENGAPLTAAAYPSLTDILATIAKNSTASGGGGGTGVEIIGSDSSKVAPATVFTKPKAETIKTTLNAQLQAKAEQAVKQKVLQGKSTGVAVVRPGDGHILALAYSGSSGNLAINGTQPPGSSMKILTAAALFDQANLTPTSTLKCDTTQLASGQVFHNEKDVPKNLNASITDDFARSCNTAFVYGGGHYLLHDGTPADALHNEAAQYFGFGSWTIGGGVATTDPSIPADVSGGDRAAQFMGQGKVTLTPLALASVAATVKAGTFHQPIILPGQTQTPAPSSLSQSTDSALKTLMRAVVTGGTATPRLGDLAGVGAKTGTAEVGTTTDGWMTAYNGQIAVSSVVLGGTSGVDSAGYVVRELLQTTGS